MRVAVVAGPEAGHAFPALALCCLRLKAAGDSPVLMTGREWLGTARAAGSKSVNSLVWIGGLRRR